MSEHDHPTETGTEEARPAPERSGGDGMQPARTNTRALVIFLIVVVGLGAIAIFVIFSARSSMQDEVGQDEVAFDFAPEGRRLADRPIQRERPEVPQAAAPGRERQPAPRSDSRRERVEAALEQLEEMRKRSAEAEAAERARRDAEREQEQREAAQKAYENRRRAGAVAYSSAQRSANENRRPDGPPDISEMIGQIAKIGDASIAREGSEQGRQRPSYGLGQQLDAVGDSVEVTEASWRGSQSNRLTQGTIIPGVLETAISSEGPSAVRAVVAQNVYSTDGRRLLVPRGSRLFGQHASNVQRGGERVGIIWTRLQRPDGVDAMIRSPGTDAIGIGGVDGIVKRHFWQRFGAALLFSLIDVAQSRSGNQDTAVLVNDGSRVGEQIIRQTVDIPPTVLVPQGKQINVLLARDIDFSGVLQEGYSYQ